MNNDFDDFQPPPNDPFNSGDFDEGFDEPDQANRAANSQEPPAAGGGGAGGGGAGDDGASGEDGADPEMPRGSNHADSGPAESVGPRVMRIGGPHADFVDVEAKVLPELNMEAIERILQEDALLGASRTNLMFTHGPMDALATQFKELVKNQCGHEGVIEALHHHLNAAFHDAVQENWTVLYKPDGTPLNAKTAAGLEARKTTLEDANKHFATNSGHLISALDDAGYPASELAKLVHTNMKARVMQMNTLLETKVERFTLADSVIMGAQNLYAKTMKNGDYAGDVRAHNNRRMNETLLKLKDVGAELRFNAGNVDWERTHGKACQQAASKLFSDLAQATRGREHLINARSLKARMDEIRPSFEESIDMLADEDMKKQMKKLAKAMAEMVERIAQMIKRALNRFEKPSMA
ncbi:hypothetical protein [Hydrogenophaga sp. 2FB]|uniref:hypothetical protein n=1 Tax=Hydrogenophaga sp. 2FB TaxID=2502187 RepID=UPI0010F6252D|nr:hypothetical protein [Hydrogenophaga sp. 2FB]